jgi:hypothetical protein
MVQHKQETYNFTQKKLKKWDVVSKKAYTTYVIKNQNLLQFKNLYVQTLTPPIGWVSNNYMSPRDSEWKLAI